MRPTSVVKAAALTGLATLVLAAPATAYGSGIQTIDAALCGGVHQPVASLTGPGATCGPPIGDAANAFAGRTDLGSWTGTNMPLGVFVHIAGVPLPGEEFGPGLGTTFTVTVSDAKNVVVATASGLTNFFGVAEVPLAAFRPGAYTVRIDTAGFTDNGFPPTYWSPTSVTGSFTVTTPPRGRH